MGATKERRILVAVDESEESMNALSWCLKTFHNPSIIDFPKYSNDIADCVIEKAKRMCREQFQDVKVDTMIEHGDPRDFFCQITEKLHVDMLVMGRHGYGVIKSHLKQKSIILDEEDEPPTKRNKDNLSPPSEED